MGKQNRNKTVNLSGHFKCHQTLIWLTDVELRKRRIQKGAKREQQKLGKKGRDRRKKGMRERGRIWNTTVIWNQAQENNFCTTSVTGCIKSSLGLHYKVKNPTRFA